MANYDFSAASADTRYQVYTPATPAVVRRHIVDIAKVVTAKGSALATSDTIDVMPIYAGEFIRSCKSRIITAGTASSTVTVGDQSNATNLIASVACDAAAGTMVVGAGAKVNTATAYATTASTVRLTAGVTAPQTGVIEFILEVEQVGTSATV